jgi:hypothetical protein
MPAYRSVFPLTMSGPVSIPNEKSRPKHPN